MVEIARAVKHNAEIIIFDEPTASLTPEEKRHFFALIRRLKRARRLHRLHLARAEEALRDSDRITILRDGELVVTNETAEFDRESSSPPWSAARCHGDLRARRKARERGASGARRC